VGVLPPSFDFSAVFTPGSRVDMLVPFPLTPETDRWGNTLAVLGRLKPGVSLGQAQAELEVINDQLRRAHPEMWTFGARLTGLRLLPMRAALGTCLLFGIAPALQTSRSNASEAVKDTGRGSSEGRSAAWTRSMLIVSEVALSCVLAVGAGLLIRSFLRVLDVD